ncbi:MAG: tetratricopeptide repeat protein, partial [Thermodesulfovibrionia bacterium]|nr:tetratricopeptide repeat protein [Thermodesulfovibrionia bacterium]
MYIGIGNRDNGIEEYKKVFRMDEGNVQALIKLAAVLEAEKKDDEALIHFKKAAEKKTSVGYLSLAGFFFRKKENKKAIKVLDEALINNPRDINALDFRGNIYESEKNYKKALTEYKNMKNLSYERGVSRIVRVYESMGTYDNAIDELKNFVAETANKPAILGKIADLHIKKKDYKEAENVANTIISLNPDNDFGYKILAKTYMLQNHLAEAIHTLNKAIELNPHNIENQIMLGSAYMSEGDIQKALKVYKKVEEKNPTYAPVYFLQGNIFETTGNIQSALEKYIKTLELAPNHVLALNNLAYLYAEGHGDINEAIKMA